MIKKLRLKFICVIMAIVAVLLCVILGMIMHFTAEDMERQSLEMMQKEAKHPPRLGDIEEKPDSVRLPFFVVQLDRNGTITGTGGGYFDLSDKENLQEIVDTVITSGAKAGILKEYNLRYLKENSPGGQNIVFADMTSERSTLINLISTCVLVGVGTLVVFFVLSIYLSKWAVKPVEDMWIQQKQFVADASHELKTPLSVIMANAELMQNTAVETEKKAVYAENILTTSYQMRTLIENLLGMARVDDGGVKANFVSIDFSRFVCDAALSFQLLYEEKNMGLNCRVADGIMIKGDEAGLYQVMDVLLDNALKYSNAGSTVEVVLNRYGRFCRLSVAGLGEPMSKEELKNIFKRFYRGDKARTMNGSYGLGLSIAEAVVRSHKGKIWAESQNGFNVFHVMLPINMP